MPLIHDSEMEDFEATIINARFEVADFKLAQDEDPPTAKEQYAITGTVTMQRKSTDEFITYTVGSGLIWPQVFEADLQAGNFGEPEI